MLTYSDRSSGRVNRPAALKKKEYGKASTIQTKLILGQANGTHEQEADRVADRTAYAPATQAPALQRKSQDHKNEAAALQLKQKGQTSQTVPDTISRQIKARKGSGNPLPYATRQFMESRMGANLGNVKIHNDQQAHKLNTRLSSDAFTLHNHVFFNRDKYQPATQEGKHLIAHELAHTTQQKPNTLLLKRKKSTADFNKKNKGGKKSKLGTFAPKKLNPSLPFSAALLKFLSKLFRSGSVVHTYAEGLQVLAHLEKSKTFLELADSLDTHYSKEKNGGIQFVSGRSGSRSIPAGHAFQADEHQDIKKSKKHTILVDHFKSGNAYSGELIIDFVKRIIHETTHVYRKVKGLKAFKGIARFIYEEYSTRKLEAKMLQELLKKILSEKKKETTTSALLKARLKAIIKHVKKSIAGKRLIDRMDNVGRSTVSGTALTYIELAVWSRELYRYKSKFENLKKGLRVPKGFDIELPEITGKESDASIHMHSLNMMGQDLKYRKSIEGKNKVNTLSKHPEEVVNAIGFVGLAQLKRALRISKIKPIEKYMLLYMIQITLLKQRLKLEEFRKLHKPDPKKADVFLKKYFDVNKNYKQVLRADMKK